MIAWLSAPPVVVTLSDRVDVDAHMRSNNDNDLCIAFAALYANSMAGVTVQACAATALSRKLLDCLSLRCFLATESSKASQLITILATSQSAQPWFSNGSNLTTACSSWSTRQILASKQLSISDHGSRYWHWHCHYPYHYHYPGAASACARVLQGLAPLVGWLAIRSSRPQFLTIATFEFDVRFRCRCRCR